MAQESEDDDKFAGAYVKEPIPGLYGWNIDEDLTSLYPSLAILLNCGLETLLFKIVTTDPFDDSWRYKGTFVLKDETYVVMEKENSK
jgi:DNA polymerase elongation subunit (family B)